ncbi:alpha/beta fold hydrolase [Pendulispora albinea]|uniref:Alpha/beta hydrolase n=1 Tax=Pendulispora albinea TaxID=2741071 RepID=A0ABZ2LM10_9BACT
MRSHASLIATRDVSARGARVRLVEAGEGPALLLVHGCLSSRLVWEDVLPKLATHFRVIAPDLPGFGQSEKPPPARYAYGFNAFAESLVDVVAALGLGRISICGHGMGGSVALTLAARHAALVDKLVLVDPIVYPPRTDALSRLANMPIVGPFAFKQLCGRTVFRSYFKDRVYAPDSTIPWNRVDHHFDLFNAPAAREAALATLRALHDTRPLVALLPRVAAPTLLVWGRSDRTLPVAQGRRLARELRNARYEVFECGHSPPEEVPDAFAEIAASFLATQGGKAA